MKRPLGVGMAALLLSLSSMASAQTTIPGGVLPGTVNRWTAAGSPYVVERDTTVPAGATLFVEAGVEIRFRGQDVTAPGNRLVELFVDGRIEIDGAADNPVLFRGTSALRHHWSGIHIRSGGSGWARHAVFRHSTQAIYAQDDFEVEGCHFDQAGGVMVEGGVVSVSRSVFQNNGSAVILLEGEVHLDNLLVHGSTTRAIEIYGLHPGASTIDHCTIVDNFRTGIDFFREDTHTLTIRNSIIASTDGVGLLDRGDGGVIAENVLFWDNSGGNTVGPVTERNTSHTRPFFVGAEDWHLMETSPAIDAGEELGVSEDLEGRSRPVDGNGRGGAEPDLGCYEYRPPAECGNGAVEGDEECDDGNEDDTDGCVMCAAARCGDGVVQAGVEACDDGNEDHTDDCVMCAAARCGDGFVQAGVELCDDGNTVGGDGCPAGCGEPVCGDGAVDGAEACDDGNRIDGDGCTNACLEAVCGDGIVHTAVEACDDGNESNADACLNGCLLASCGDGFVREGVEACDDGNDDDDDGCTSMCALQSCGNGIVEVGEACDDGNASNSDDCLSTCQRASCGDGFRHVGSEECDDGNTSDADACLSSCEAARCGDGVVQDGVEECDDGNTSDGDACLSSCEAARCGDGVVQDGVEECDDGNSEGGDGCDGVCQREQADAGMQPLDAGVLDAGDAGIADLPAEGGGCSCRSAEGQPGHGPAALLLLMLGLVFVRRRR